MTRSTVLSRGTRALIVGVVAFTVLAAGFLAFIVSGSMRSDSAGVSSSDERWAERTGDLLADQPGAIGSGSTGVTPDRPGAESGRLGFGGDENGVPFKQGRYRVSTACRSAAAVTVTARFTDGEAISKRYACDGVIRDFFVTGAGKAFTLQLSGAEGTGIWVAGFYSTGSDS